MRLGTLDKFRLRLGWLRVVARKLGRPEGRERRWSIEELSRLLLDSGERQGRWLADVAPPAGKVSKRGARSIALMASDYGVFDAQTQHLTGMGLVLWALDQEEGDSNPMFWSAALGLFGLRITMATHGAVVLPLLKAWSDEMPLQEQVVAAAAAAERLHPDEERASALVQGLETSSTWRERLAYPLLEPLRDLGVVVKSAGDYKLTERGKRLRAALPGSLDVDAFIRSHLAGAWASACGWERAQTTEQHVLDLWADYELRLGLEARETHWEWFSSYAQCRLGSGTPHRIIEEDGLLSLIESIIRNRGHARMRPGDFGREFDLVWTPELFAAHSRASEATEPRPLREQEQAPSQIVVASGVLPESQPELGFSPGPDPTGPGEQTAPNVRLAGWKPRMDAIIRLESTSRHGGPSTWIRAAQGELAGTPEGILDSRRRAKAYAKGGPSGAAHSAFLHDVELYCSDWPEADALRDVAVCWRIPDEVSTPQLRLALQHAIEQVPRFQERVRSELEDWLAAEGPIGRGEPERVLSWSQWLVDDMLASRTDATGELLGRLWGQEEGSDWRSLLALLVNPGERTWQASQSLEVQVDDPRHAGLLDLALRNSPVPELTWRDGTSSVLFETDATGATRREAWRAAEEARDLALARLEFALRRIAPSARVVSDGHVELDDEPVPAAIPEPSDSEPPESWGIVGSSPEPYDWTASTLNRTLVLLARSRSEETPALRLAHLWSAIEHLVTGGAATKGPEVVLQFSLAAAWLEQLSLVGALVRQGVALLHRGTFIAGRRDQCIACLDTGFPGQRQRYESIQGAVAQAYDALFGEPFVISDQRAFTHLGALAASKDQPGGLEEWVAALDSVEPWLAADLRDLGQDFSKKSRYCRRYTRNREAVGSLLVRTYEVRNRVVHNGDIADGDGGLLRLAQRVANVVEPVVAHLLTAGDIEHAFARWQEMRRRLHCTNKEGSPWYERVLLGPAS